MKRLNPATNLFFRSGDVREDGYIFYQYSLKRKTANGFFVECWVKPSVYKKHKQDNRHGSTRNASNFIAHLLNSAKSRCKGTPSRTASGRLPTNGNVTITRDWILKKLEKGICEATGDKLTIVPRKNNTASLDRIDPNNPDYTPENCRIVTWQFNNMKGAYTDKEFIRVAKQLENAKQKSTAHISTEVD